MSSSTPAAQLRKIKKPMIERRRRERINYCLNQLKSIVLEATEKDETQYSKMEKADILEMTVAYLHSTRRWKQGLKAASITDNSRLQSEVHSVPKSRPNVSSVDNSDFTNIKTDDVLPSEKDLVHRPYSAGYRECAEKVQNYLADVSQNLDSDGADVMAAVGRKLDRYLMTRSSTSPSSAMNCSDCFRHRIERIIAESPQKSKTKSSTVAGRTEHANDTDSECVDMNNNDVKRNVDDVETELASLSGSSGESDVRLRDSRRISPCSDSRAASSTPPSDDDRRHTETFFDADTGCPLVPPPRYDLQHEAFNFFINVHRHVRDSLSSGAFPLLPMFTTTGQPGTNSLPTAIKGSQIFSRNSPFSLQLSRLNDGLLACPVAASQQQVASMISASHMEMMWQPWL